MLVKPSPSKSAFGSEERTVRVLLVEGTAEEIPVPVVATTVNDPLAFEASVNVIVAVVPFVMFTLDAVIAGGVKAGKKENVAPVRFSPVT
jgi:hypothetical protein